MDIILIVFAVLLVIFIAAGLFLRRLRTQNETAIRAKFPSARLIVSDTLFFGQESSGMTQMRGTGTLVITDTDLYFRRWMPVKEYAIPLNRIESIETPKIYLGKSYGRPLLKVNFRGEDGQADSMGWFMRDHEAVKAQIEAARHL